jgi:hypothetical protein
LDERGGGNYASRMTFYVIKNLNILKSVKNYRYRLLSQQIILHFARKVYLAVSYNRINNDYFHKHQVTDILIVIGFVLFEVRAECLNAVKLSFGFTG